MLWIGFDVGGTFTDLVAIDLGSGKITAAKTPSSPTDPAAAAARGIAELLALAGAPASSVARVVHGTTIATNALIVGRGAKVGFICNKGFKDVIEIGRMLRESLYDINFTKTPPLVARDLRREVRSRVDADGSIVEPLDEAEVIRAATSLRAAGVESIAVGLLHSYAHPRDERRIRELVREVAPELPVTLSHEVSGEYGEFERWNTAVVNAFLRPMFERYLGTIGTRLADLGITAQVEIVQSNGGVVPIAVAAAFPVRLLSSGPAGGVSGMGHFAKQIGISKLITFDVGGTSTDVCVVIDGRPSFTTEQRVGGQQLRALMADIHSIGAGGGSIAAIDSSKTLRVGPDSAGAEPGPVATGKGGTRPTITDADVVLGYINPLRFAAGRYPIDVAAAREAIDRQIAQPTGTTPEQAALGIVGIAVRNMVSAIKTITTRRGIDPRDFALFVSGGAGALHAGLVARELHIGTVVVPAYPAMLSAQGMLFAQYRTDVSRTFRKRLADTTIEELAGVLAELDRAGKAVLASASGTFSTEHWTELCYEGQQHGLVLPLPDRALTTADAADLSGALDRLFMELYGFVPPNSIPKFVNLRSFVRKHPPEAASLGTIVVREENRSEAPARSTRRVVFSEHPQGVEVAVHDRVQLAAGAKVVGPAIIEEDYSSVVVFPGQSAEVDHLGNVIIRTGGS